MCCCHCLCILRCVNAGVVQHRCLGVNVERDNTGISGCCGGSRTYRWTWSGCDGTLGNSGLDLEQDAGVVQHRRWRA